MYDFSPRAGETLDHLAGDWKIFQLKGGHRFSADDVLTAWTAARAVPDAARVLDLGCGIGSVGLLTLYRLAPQATLVGIERQRLSLDLAIRTASLNGLQERTEFRPGDIRDPAILPDSEKFPLITGSPPYFPIGSATLSPHPQRAAARVELHGDVFDYCRRAAAHLQQEGRFAFVHAASDPRPARAIEQVGLQLLQRQEVYFRRHLAPTVALYLCGWSGPRSQPEPFVIRGSNGLWSEDYLQMRRDMGTVVWNP